MSNDKEVTTKGLATDKSKPEEGQDTTNAVARPNKPNMGDKVYVSHKQVKAFPMNRGDYNAYRGWELPAGEDASEMGYLVEYMDGGKPNHPNHEGYISWSPKAQFDNGYKDLAEVEAAEVAKQAEFDAAIKKAKTLNNSNVNMASKQVGDLEIYGNGDLFQLVSKASSKSEDWMKSTKACNLPTGVLVQVTTQQGDNVAEALQFVPGVRFNQKKNQFTLLN
jgi:hypothetical protein